jgi:tetratricopeptide (TPR) repeat protein
MKNTADSPDNSDTQKAARALLRRGDAAGAERLCRAALLVDPARDDLLAPLGLALAALDRPQEALGCFSALTAQQPGNAGHWINRGTLERSLGRLDDALGSYMRAASLGEGSASFLYNVGLLHLDRGDYESARQVLADAARLAPRDADVVWQYAQCCHDTLRLDEARIALRGWRTLAPAGGRLAAIALLLLNLGELAEATEAAQLAATGPALSAESLLHLGQIAERSNDVAGARSFLERLRAKPDASRLAEDVDLLAAQLAARERHTDEAIATFARLAASCREPHRRHLFLFPLAKALDAAERWDEAAAVLRDAHAAQRLQLSRTHPQLDGWSEPPLVITRRGCRADDTARWPAVAGPSAAASPVFIVAFPRSGTTLLEQMLDAHPALVTMDEQPFLQNAIDELVDAGVDYPVALAAADKTALERARGRYWSLVAHKVALAPGQRLIDKNPLNLLRLPAIRRLFPHAQVLLAIRHPADVLVSCWMQHFLAPEFVLMCRDLPTLARSYDRCFRYWYEQQALLHAQVLEVRYEQFVGAFEHEARRIADFLGLPWDDAMLQPGTQARARGFISTPSYAQVIEPVNTRSVGRWQRYEREFADALPVLKPWLERWGYDG